jgi:hypothetical protein
MYGKAVGALTTRIHKENERGGEGAGGRDTRSYKMNKKDERCVLCSYKKSYISFYLVFFSHLLLLMADTHKTFFFLFFLCVLIKKETMLFTILIERWRAAVAALSGLGALSGRRDIFGLSKLLLASGIE